MKKKLKSLCTVAVSCLIVCLLCFTSRLRRMLYAYLKLVGTEPDCLDPCASDACLIGITNHERRHAEATQSLAACMIHNITLPSLNADKDRALNQTCNHLGIFAECSTLKARDAALRPTKCIQQLLWLSKLILLGICVYGPVLPMWYLPTTSIPAPMWLLLATQAWISGGLCLLASSWFEILNYSHNNVIHGSAGGDILDNNLTRFGRESLIWQ